MLLSKGLQSLILLYKEGPFLPSSNMKDLSKEQVMKLVEIEMQLVH